MRKHAATIALTLILATTATVADAAPARERSGGMSFTSIVRKYVQRVIRAFDGYPTVPTPVVRPTDPK